MLPPLHLHRTIWGHQLGCDPTEGTDPNKAGDFPGLQVVDVSHVSYMGKGGGASTLGQSRDLFYF